MRLFLRKIPPVVFLVRLGRKVAQALFFTPINLGRYTKAFSPRKLHLGCGDRYLPGWLNSDLSPSSFRSIRIDAEKRFPIQSNTFHFIYTEHMIEHIPYTSAEHMLKECLRILVPGGKLRVSTPDLQFLVNLYLNPSSPILESYISWTTKKFLGGAPCSETFVINNFVRAWGHQFIYDAKTLESLLLSCGYINVRFFDIGVSDCDELANLENVGRMPDGFLALESMIVQAEKIDPMRAAHVKIVVP